MKDFYPTPNDLLEEITKGIDWKNVKDVLEPSAGKGDIAEYCREKKKQIYGHIEIDCIEADSDLRSILKGRKFRVVHDDFLTFHTFKKYDLIIMNPPFSEGAEHLMHALGLLGDGSGLICILNAETLRNPYTNLRKDLNRRLGELGAEIRYMEHAFANAERRTDVEIAVVKVYVPKKERQSHIYEELRRKKYSEHEEGNIDALAVNDFVRAAVQMYELETEAGLKLIREYKALVPHIMDGNGKYSKPVLELKLGNDELSENAYVKHLRTKYWEMLFNSPKITGAMASRQRSEYLSRVSELSEYDFSYYNIKTLQEEMSRGIVRGIEDCIIGLFDELSSQYAWYDTSANIHYYNGWKTNKAWIINKKVILPINAFSWYDKRYDPCYTVREKLADIEKALNYLDGGLTDGISLNTALTASKNAGQTRKIPLKYFYVTFYKKGTCHIEFKDMELLKKLNIFGSQQKGWLPPSYGKRKYEEMEPEEREVVDGFEGEAGYRKTLADAAYFIYDPRSSVKCLEGKNH